ncbi:hypothetical protein CRENPOLYSF2_2940002 [Crenothrix polyspora]|uniref:Uncharacterized protein n=1 Tax=Crenothrix polyspora TaxID=360316 RepID=A0A1R4H9C0_9GAMM|nr:hypothetical protein CRENPOLYSF2_2940002 [Crenothrix polyspora]
MDNAGAVFAAGAVGMAGGVALLGAGLGVGAGLVLKSLGQFNMGISLVC